VAWKVRAAGVSPSDQQAVSRLLAVTRVTMRHDAGRVIVLVDRQDVTDEIRTSEISDMASVVAAIPAVREWLLPVQRQIGARGGVVAEGRDLGTRVFPAAPAKFFLEADMDVRVARRHSELAAAGHAVAVRRATGGHPRIARAAASARSMPSGPTSRWVTARIVDGRDARDRSRHLAPLVAAVDACVIDTTALTADQVVERMMAVIVTKL